MSPDQMTTFVALVVDGLAERETPAVAAEVAEVAEIGLTAREVAQWRRRTYEWVLDNKIALGGYPVGSGPRPHWQFDRAPVEAYFAELGAKARAAAEQAEPQPKQRAPRKPKSSHGELELLDFKPLRRVA